MITLDGSQLGFCQSISPNNRLLAPAGCGKTSALLYRCRDLLEQSDRPQRFLLLSFTNAAAAEMRERLEADDDFANLRNAVLATTLNSWGWRRLNNRHGSAKLLTNATDRFFAVRNQLAPIVEKHQSIAHLLTTNNGPRSLMNVIDALKSLRFDHNEHTSFDKFNSHVDLLEARGLSALVAKQFDDLTGLEVLESVGDGDEASTSRRQFYNKFFTFWRDAVKHLHGELTFTFEDQKYWNYLDLPTANPVLAPNRYHHVLVDEFQDINPLDLALIDLIVKAHQASLTIVGDDDQAIFEWRGASPEFILEPETHFERSFATHTLEVNYRSPRNIVYHSQKLIANNKRRVSKTVRGIAARPDAHIEVIHTSDINTELDFVTEIVRNTSQPGRVAVISKVRAQLIPYEIHFASSEIEFETATDLDLFQNDALAKVTRMLEIRDNKDQQNYPAQAVRGATEICDLIRQYSGRRNRENLTAYLNGVAPATVSQAVAAIANYSGPRLTGKDHSDLHSAASKFLNTGDTANALRCLGTEFAGLRRDFQRAEEQIFYIDPPLQQLATLVEQNNWTGIQLAQMIQKAQSRIREFTALNDDNNGPEGLHQRPLHLMTATRSKGKEFETVIILGALDKMWPHSKTETEAQMEAERRLFYVAFTRAKERVLMLAGPDQAPLSPFIHELELPAI